MYLISLVLPLILLVNEALSTWVSKFLENSKVFPYSVIKCVKIAVHLLSGEENKLHYFVHSHAHSRVIKSKK